MEILSDKSCAMAQRRRGFKNPQRQRGMSLIEILVALLVFSLGIMSITKLQVSAKLANYDATQRMTATLLANDIIERMRINYNGLSSYVNATLGAGTTTTPATSCNSAAAICTSAQMATLDLYEWDMALAGASETSSGNKTGGLVSPTGCITSSVAGGTGNYTVAVAYVGSTALSNPTASTCGQTSGKYGTSNEFRRVVVLSVYIVTE